MMNVYNKFSSPPVSRTRVTERSHTTSLRPGSEFWSESFLISNAKSLELATTSSNIWCFPQCITKNPSDWNKNRLVISEQLLLREGWLDCYKLRPSFTYLLVLERDQIALMISKHLHGNKHEFRSNEIIKWLVALHVPFLYMVLKPVIYHCRSDHQWQPCCPERGEELHKGKKTVMWSCFQLCSDRH